MTTKLEQAARQALEALETDEQWGFVNKKVLERRLPAITALREALAEPKKPEECANGCPQLQVCDYCQIAEQAGQPVAYKYKESSPETGEFVFAEQAEQEPVAWRDSNGWFTSDKQLVNTKYDKWTAVYAAPVRTKDLTDEELCDVIRKTQVSSELELYRAAIAADREKNK